jgi:hypothetical protein
MAPPVVGGVRQSVTKAATVISCNGSPSHWRWLPLSLAELEKASAPPVVVGGVGRKRQRLQRLPQSLVTASPVVGRVGKKRQREKRPSSHWQRLHQLSEGVEKSNNSNDGSHSCRRSQTTTLTAPPVVGGVGDCSLSRWRSRTKVAMVKTGPPIVGGVG